MGVHRTFSTEIGAGYRWCSSVSSIGDLGFGLGLDLLFGFGLLVMLV